PGYVPELQGMVLPSGDDELAVGREGDAGPAVEPGQLAVALLPQVVPFEAAQVRLSRPGAQALQALLNARVIVLFPTDLQVAHGDRVVGVAADLVEELDLFREGIPLILASPNVLVELLPLAPGLAEIDDKPGALLRIVPQGDSQSEQAADGEDADR